jgi:hypothetical protein
VLTRGGGSQLEQAAALAERAAAQAPLDDPAAVGWPLDSLREEGAEEQATALLHRDPAAHVSLDDQNAVVDLLDSLREEGAEDQATALFELFREQEGRQDRFRFGR